MAPVDATIYTDGACIGNPGPGGYGVILLANGKRVELSGGFRRTTNNRMELTAVIVGLKELSVPARVRLYSDSTVFDQRHQPGLGAPVARQRVQEKKNADLWNQILDLSERHQVEFIWIQGHSGQPENERCDQLSVQAAQRRNLPADEFFERSEEDQTPLTLF